MRGEKILDAFGIVRQEVCAFVLKVGGASDGLFDVVGEVIRGCPRGRCGGGVQNLSLTPCPSPEIASPKGVEVGNNAAAGQLTDELDREYPANTIYAKERDTPRFEQRLNSIRTIRRKP